MDNQELFDRVKTHLLKQMKKSDGERFDTAEIGCLYRTEDGLKCAIGCLIPDDKYDPIIEGFVLDQNVFDTDNDVLEPSELRLKEILMGVGIEEGNLELLADLQDTHDMYEPREWEQTLVNVALEYALEN